VEKVKYSEKLKDPRWQKKRLEILERDLWTCRWCGDKNTTLHVHHIFHLPGREPWNIPDGFLITLCETCHKPEEPDNNPPAAITEFIGSMLDKIFITSKEDFVLTMKMVDDVLDTLPDKALCGAPFTYKKGNK